MVEMVEVHRQQALWQREATQRLAAGHTAEGLEQYATRDLLTGHQTVEDARSAVLQAWSKAAEDAPEQKIMMLAYTRADVLALNEAARDILKSRGRLQAEQAIETNHGTKPMAVGERVLFLRNERSLELKNGSLGTINAIDGATLEVRLDAQPTSTIKVDTRFYRDVDYGYAITIHKSQGSTVDRAFVLATRHLDRHATYVALSRHRLTAEVHFAFEQFENRSVLSAALSRARPKDMAIDFIDHREPAPEQTAQRVDVAKDPGVLARFKERIDAAFQKHRGLQEREATKAGDQIALTKRRSAPRPAPEEQKRQEEVQRERTNTERQRHRSRSRGMDR